MSAIFDANYKFIDIKVRCYGKAADSTISEWIKKIRQGNYNLSNARPISNNGLLMPFTFNGFNRPLNVSVDFSMDIVKACLY